MLTTFFIVLAAATAVVLLLGNLLTAVLQDVFIFRPERLPAGFEYRFAAPFEEVTLAAPEGGRLNALWFRQPGSRGLVLYFHGNTGNLVRWGNLYRFFFQHGHDFLVYDYRGFGKSRGRRSERLLHQDARLLYDFARRSYPSEKIVIFGRSIGSAFACRLAAEAPARMLILETPFAGMRELFYTYYPFFPRLFRFKYRFDNQRQLGRVRCPVFIFQGTHDFIVPESCARRLESALKPGDGYFSIPMGRHNDLMIYEEYQRRMQSVLAEKSVNE